MNLKFPVIAVSVCLGAIIFGGLLNLRLASNVSPPEKIGISVDFKEIDTAGWRNVFESIEKYNPLPVVTTSDEDKSDEREQTLSDARLVGTVLTNNNRALLLLPGSTEPIELAVGQQWLEQWTLLKVKQTEIIWKNEETNQQQRQVLFK